jgi:hypothetical protein
MRFTTACVVTLLLITSFSSANDQEVDFPALRGRYLEQEASDEVADGQLDTGLPLCIGDKPEGMVFVNKRGISKSGFMSGTTGQIARWTSKYASISFTVVGYQLAWAGMNEKGLVMSTMALPETQNPEADMRPALHSPHWMQYMLDNCASVREVIAADSQVRIYETVDHYLVADSTGDCAVIDFLDGRMVVYTGRELPAAVLTNSTYSESVGFLKKGAAGVREKDGIRTISSSLRRFKIAANRAAEFDPAGADNAVNYAFETLEKVGGDGTLWSIVFDTHDLSVYFRTKSNRAIRSLT